MGGVGNIDMRYEEESEQVSILEVNPHCWTSLFGSLSVRVNFLYLHFLEGIVIPCSRPAYPNNGVVVKELLDQFRAWKRRGEHQRRVTLGATACRNDMADPLPNAATLARSTFKWYKKGAKNRYRSPRYPSARYTGKHQC